MYNKKSCNITRLFIIHSLISNFIDILLFFFDDFSLNLVYNI